MSIATRCSVSAAFGERKWMSVILPTFCPLSHTSEPFITPLASPTVAYRGNVSPCSAPTRENFRIASAVTRSTTQATTPPRTSNQPSRRAIRSALEHERVGAGDDGQHRFAVERARDRPGAADQRDARPRSRIRAWGLQRLHRGHAVARRAQVPAFEVGAAVLKGEAVVEQ